MTGKISIIQQHARRGKMSWLEWNLQDLSSESYSKGCFSSAESLKFSISVLEAQERLLCFGPCCEDDWCFSSKVVMTHKLSWEQTTKVRLLSLWGGYQESHTLSYTYVLFLGAHKPCMLSDTENHLHRGWKFPSITSMYSLTTLHKDGPTNVKLSWQGLSTMHLPSISLSATVQIKVSPRRSAVHLSKCCCWRGSGLYARYLGSSWAQ